MAESNQGSLTVSSIKAEKTYSEKLKVKVIKVCEADSAGTSKLRVCLADNTGWTRGSVHLRHESLFKNGRSLMLRGFFYKDGILFVGEKALVYRSAPVEVTPAVLQMADTDFAKPVFSVKPIAEVLSSPERRRVSVSGVVITAHKTREIKTKGGEAVPIKDLEIQDNSGVIKASLWRQATEVECHVGQRVTLKDVSADYSAYHKSTTLSVNLKTNVEFNAEEDVDIELLAIQNESAEETVTMLCCSGATDRELTVKWEVLTHFMEVSIETDIEDLLGLFPVQCKATIEKNEIVKLH